MGTRLADTDGLGPAGDTFRLEMSRAGIRRPVPGARAARILCFSVLCAGGLLVTACEDRSESLNKIGLSTAELTKVSADTFAELCIDSLPSMDGLQEKLEEIALKRFGKPPSLNRNVYGAASHVPSGMSISRGTPEWNEYDGEYRCEVSATAITLEDAATRMVELFEERAGPGITLAEAKPDGPGEREAWSVSGAKPDMRLEVVAGSSASGGTRQTSLRLVWK